MVVMQELAVDLPLQEVAAVAVVAVAADVQDVVCLDLPALLVPLVNLAVPENLVPMACLETLENPQVPHVNP
jgi:hypothetical protein